MIPNTDRMADEIARLRSEVETLKSGKSPEERKEEAMQRAQQAADRQREAAYETFKMQQDELRRREERWLSLCDISPDADETLRQVGLHWRALGLRRGEAMARFLYACAGKEIEEGIGIKQVVSNWEEIPEPVREHLPMLLDFWRFDIGQIENG